MLARTLHIDGSMSTILKAGLSVCLALGSIAAPLGAPGPAQAVRGQQAAIDVPANVALSSLIALSDLHLQKFSDAFAALAATSEGRSDDPDVFGPPLRGIAERNTPALVWRAWTDGHYWSVQEGPTSGNLSQRAYFADLLAGRPVIGPLVVSTATGKSVAIVAVPVRDTGGRVIGAFGASVYLDRLSARLTADLVLPEGMIFYSFDAEPLLALEWDPSLIFVDPLSLDPEIRAAFEYMLQRSDGAVRYRFRDQWRTVIFRRSQVTGWWYALGVVQGRGPAAR